MSGASGSDTSRLEWMNGLRCRVVCNAYDWRFNLIVVLCVRIRLCLEYIYLFALIRIELKWRSGGRVCGSLGASVTNTIECGWAGILIAESAFECHNHNAAPTYLNAHQMLFVILIFVWLFYRPGGGGRGEGKPTHNLHAQAHTWRPIDSIRHKINYLSFRQKINGFHPQFAHSLTLARPENRPSANARTQGKKKTFNSSNAIFRRFRRAIILFNRIYENDE